MLLTGGICRLQSTSQGACEEVGPDGKGGDYQQSTGKKEVALMASYLYIESCEPFESQDVAEGYRLVAELAAKGTPVTLFLVQNGVLAARQGAHAGQFAELAANPSITVMADTFALQERGMTPDALTPGVQAETIDTLVDLLVLDGQKAIWH